MAYLVMEPGWRALCSRVVVRWLSGCDREPAYSIRATPFGGSEPIAGSRLELSTYAHKSAKLAKEVRMFVQNRPASIVLCILFTLVLISVPYRAGLKGFQPTISLHQAVAKEGNKGNGKGASSKDGGASGKGASTGSNKGSAGKARAPEAAKVPRAKARAPEATKAPRARADRIRAQERLLLPVDHIGAGPITGPAIHGQPQLTGSVSAHRTCQSFTPTE